MMLAIALAAQAATAPSTADLSFMLGEWRLEGAFNPGTAQQVKETGTQRCDLALDQSYVRCEWAMTNEKGRKRQLVSYHNYNRLNGRFEHLYVASNWPTKVIGTSSLASSGKSRTMTVDIRFTLPDGRDEHIRSLKAYSGDAFTIDEQIRVGVDGEWRTNTRFVGTRTR